MILSIFSGGRVFLVHNMLRTRIYPALLRPRWRGKQGEGKGLSGTRRPGSILSTTNKPGV